MYDPTYPLFPICAFLGFVLALVPLPWHLEALNSATCYFMLWSSIACLNQFVNSVVWADTAINLAPVWCDISTRIIIGASVGIPASSLCINRRLYKIARLNASTITRAEKRRAIIVDTLICVLFPLICMALAYVVQGHRFNVYENVGCNPSLYNTVLAYFLVSWWPVVIGLVSAVYCVLSLRAFTLRRTQFNSLISSKSTSLTFGRYFRLMALAVTEMLMTVPASSYMMYLNATAEPIEPWVSWSYVHVDFSRVVEVPAVLWRTDAQVTKAVLLGQWLNPLSAFIFFAYFGLASEARRNYSRAFWFILGRLGLSKPRRDLSLPSHSLKSLRNPGFSAATDEQLPAYAPPIKLHDISGLPSARSMTFSDKLMLAELASDSYAEEKDRGYPMSPSSTFSVTSPSDSTTFVPSCDDPASPSHIYPGLDSPTSRFTISEATIAPDSPCSHTLHDHDR